MTKKFLGIIGLIIFWAAILAYAFIWGHIFNFFERLFKSGDPLGWSGVVAMFVVIYTGVLIYGTVKFIAENMKKNK